MRFLYIVGGLIGLALSAAMNVREVGGIETNAALGMIGVAVVLAIGSAAVGDAVRNRHHVIAAVITAGMLIGDIAIMTATAQRVATARAELRAPELEAMTARDAAETRLERAETAVAAAERDVTDKAALPGCKRECGRLLSEAKARAISERDAARAALQSTPGTANTSGAFAEATGAAQWLLDTIESLGMAFALNLPSSALIALGVSMSPRRRETALERNNHDAVALSHNARQAPPPVVIEGRPVGAVAEFMRHAIEPHDGRVEIADLYRCYLDWCRGHGRDALPADVFGERANAVIEAVGIDVIRSRGHVYLVGVRVALPSAAIAAE